jgi:hypothetical protein
MSLDNTENTLIDLLIKKDPNQREKLRDLYNFEEFLFKFFSQITFKVIFVVLFLYFSGQVHFNHCKLGNRVCFYLAIFYITSILFDIISIILLIGFRKKRKFERILNYLDYFIVLVFPLGYLTFLVLLTYLYFKKQICGYLNIIVLTWITLFYLLLIITLIICISMYCFRKESFLKNYKKIFFYMEANSSGLIPLFRPVPDDLRDASDQNQLIAVLDKNLEGLQEEYLKNKDFEMLTLIDNVLENLKNNEYPHFADLKELIFEFLINIQNGDKKKIFHSCLKLEKFFENFDQYN